MAEPMSQSHPGLQSVRAYIFAILIPTVIYFLVRVLQRPPKRFPEAPWLRLSAKPGKEGEREDELKFVDNGHKVIMAGYKKVRPCGLLEVRWLTEA